jgi:hypothetical protein
MHSTDITDKYAELCKNGVNVWTNITDQPISTTYKTLVHTFTLIANASANGMTKKHLKMGAISRIFPI